MNTDLQPLAMRWNRKLRRDEKGAALLPPLFVLEQGAALHLIDLGRPEDLSGVSGYIPGSAFVRPESLQVQVDALPHDLPVVLVSGVGRTAAQWALRLEREGRRPVAALEGGVAAWRHAGLRTDRDPAGLDVAPPATVPCHAAGKTLSLEDVRAHVGDPRSVRWVKALSMIGSARLSCVDGRDARGVVGTPGGDAGEFLLLLATLEHFQEGAFDEDDVRRMLIDRFDLLGDFYVHTDAHALDALHAAAKADPRLAPTVKDLSDDEAWQTFLERPPEACRGALLELLVDPAHLGCGHIRLMLQHGGDYSVRRGLVESFLRALHRLQWEGAPELHVTSLPGGHQEAAVVNVRLQEDLWKLSWIPLVSPSCGDTQMFVNHPQVAQYFRRAFVDALLRIDNYIAVTPDKVEAFHAHLSDLAGRQMTQTLGHLAKGLPVYDVTFDGPSSCNVEAVGKIPS